MDFSEASTAEGEPASKSDEAESTDAATDGEELHESIEGSFPVPRAQPECYRSPPSLARQGRTSMHVLAEDALIQVVRQTRAILNKLTSERFEALCDQMQALPLCSPAHLVAVVQEVFKTAIAQHGFLPLYADFCARIDKHLTSQEMFPGSGKAFRRAIANECQASFEGLLRRSLEGGIGLTRHLCNVRFIGELLTRRLLAPKLLVPILTQLLGLGSEAALESLCVLMLVVGPYAEASMSQSAALREVYRQARHWSVDSQVSKRVRFQLQDLLEAKDSGWASQA